MKKLTFIVICFSLMLVLAACGNEESQIPDVGEQQEHGFDIIETTADAAEMPAFLDETHEDIAELYEEVVKHQDLLEHIPCYCGCYESANHRDVYECFVHQFNEDGTVVWDTHGMSCGVCLEIARDAIQMKQAGLSAEDIRTAIDAHYADGYPEATPTPHP
ncbi:PCYCGC motif-containing (lipo)protein [Salsuginibacillus kocurii]|uniref:PCYCGC motif-containing (lipo)protein n=1 Tax=Salsuginibacillus kocurii TaxID=427078 RepID=UPI000360A1BB|nr:PCYCGC motif-containing (lipo)protein [Salsuginibacillus kocurii]